MPLAAERALSLSMSISLWARPLGLVGVWGALVREWLRELLPEDAAEQCKGRVRREGREGGREGGCEEDGRITQPTAHIQSTSTSHHYVKTQGTAVRERTGTQGHNAGEEQL